MLSLVFLREHFYNLTAGKSIFGYRYYTVLTGSMSPSYEVGDVVFVHIEKSDKIKEGDVITFNPSNDSETLSLRQIQKMSFNASSVQARRERLPTLHL